MSRQPLFLLYVAAVFFGGAQQDANREYADRLAKLIAEAKDLQSKGQYDGAILAMDEALRITEAVQGPSHPNAAILHGNLGVLYEGARELEQAEAEYLKALSINERARGFSDRSLVKDLKRLASLYSDQSECERALPLLRRAVAILESSQSPEASTPSTPVSSRPENGKVKEGAKSTPPDSSKPTPSERPLPDPTPKATPRPTLGMHRLEVLDALGRPSATYEYRPIMNSTRCAWHYWEPSYDRWVHDYSASWAVDRAWEAGLEKTEGLTALKYQGRPSDRYFFFENDRLVWQSSE
jgi:tetratricopeptide (TPR) repeat protein